MGFKHLNVSRDAGVERLTLARPDVRNAFNDGMINELTWWADSVIADATVRLVILEGAGPSFCAGADLEWMGRMARYTLEQNIDDASQLARVFLTLDRLPMPVIGRIHGAALGGGAGLAAICDIVAAAEDAVFGFTEVRLGIIPAVISPFVVAKIGRSAARELFLTGRRFTARHALDIGLVHDVVPPEDIEAAVNGVVREILSAGPEAAAVAKALIADVWDKTPGEARDRTALALARRRISAEGQEGLRAFLQKRKPGWSSE